MQSQLTRELVIQAVLMAIWQGRSVDSVILHFDRGTSYTWQEFRVFLQTYGLASSMIGVENCYDNAAAESFFGLLIRERVHRRQYRTRAEARADILVDIERFDNSSRSHSFN